MGLTGMSAQARQRAVAITQLSARGACSFYSYHGISGPHAAPSISVLHFDGGCVQVNEDRDKVRATP